MAIKEKDIVVLKFATKEKLLLNAQKEKEMLQNKLNERQKEIKAQLSQLNSLKEEKAALVRLLDEKVC